MIMSFSQFQNSLQKITDASCSLHSPDFLDLVFDTAAALQSDRSLLAICQLVSLDEIRYPDLHAKLHVMLQTEGFLHKDPVQEMLKIFSETNTKRFLQLCLKSRSQYRAYRNQDAEEALPNLGVLALEPCRKLYKDLQSLPQWIEPSFCLSSDQILSLKEVMLLFLGYRETYFQDSNRRLEDFLRIGAASDFFRAWVERQDLHKIVNYMGAFWSDRQALAEDYCSQGDHQEQSFYRYILNLVRPVAAANCRIDELRYWFRLRRYFTQNAVQEPLAAVPIQSAYVIAHLEENPTQTLPEVALHPIAYAEMAQVIPSMPVDMVQLVRALSRHYCVYDPKGDAKKNLEDLAMDCSQRLALLPQERALLLQEIGQAEGRGIYTYFSHSEDPAFVKILAERSSHNLDLWTQDPLLADILREKFASNNEELLRALISQAISKKLHYNMPLSFSVVLQRSLRYLDRPEEHNPYIYLIARCFESFYQDRNSRHHKEQNFLQNAKNLWKAIYDLSAEGLALEWFEGELCAFILENHSDRSDLLAQILEWRYKGHSFNIHSQAGNGNSCVESLVLKNECVFLSQILEIIGKPSDDFSFQKKLMSIARGFQKEPELFDKIPQDALKTLFLHCPWILEKKDSHCHGLLYYAIVTHNDVLAQQLYSLNLQKSQQWIGSAERLEAIADCFSFHRTSTWQMLLQDGAIDFSACLVNGKSLFQILAQERNYFVLTYMVEAIIDSRHYYSPLSENPIFYAITLKDPKLITILSNLYSSALIVKPGTYYNALQYAVSLGDLPSIKAVMSHVMSFSPDGPNLLHLARHAECLSEQRLVIIEWLLRRWIKDQEGLSVEVGTELESIDFSTLLWKFRDFFGIVEMIRYGTQLYNLFNEAIIATRLQHTSRDSVSPFKRQRLEDHYGSPLEAQSEGPNLLLSDLLLEEGGDHRSDLYFVYGANGLAADGSSPAGPEDDITRSRLSPMTYI